ILYDRVGGKGPRVVGKRDENGATLLQEILDHEPMMVASAIGARLMRYADSETLRARLGAINAQRAAAGPKGAPALARIPFFCSGCPHNTSTNVPEGSTALAGIGCHSLALYVGRATTFTHMGGEGASWIGMAPFTDTKHVFQNVGDGTYYHSGSLGIRAAIAAKVNMTFKVLYNAAVAMTGGQPVEGQPTVQQITWQLYGEGVVQTVVVNDEPLKYDWRDKFAPGVTIRHRDELDQVQRELREIPGVTVLLYDQTCAAEKRRKRKRGQFPDPQRRAFINDLVCEGCGDCSKVSNCVSVTPVETEYGRKRAIDQSACNKDYSCLKGFCPSFVTVEGGKLKKRAGVGEDPAKANVPPPILPSIAEPFPLLITGIGGTGVVTIGAILGVASRIAGQGCTVADITGLSQKNGPVMSQIMFAERQEQVASGQIAPGQAKALLACDMVTAAMPEAMSKLSIGHTRAVVNLAEVQTAEFTQNPDKVFPAAEIRRRLNERIDASQSRYIDASRIATSLMGDAVTVNMFLTGYAWQMEMIPLPWPALEQAIKLNGAQVEANLRAFAWGRRYAHEPDAVDALVVKGTTASIVAKPKTLDETIEDRAAFLVKYQNEAYAARYRQLVAGVRATEQTKVSGKTSLTEAVARYGFKLMAYKDEYEVARLHADPLFMAKLHDQFEGDFKIKFHLAPPAFAPRDPATGKLLKREFGSSMMSAFRLLGKFKFLRGTMLDPFGHTAERKQERKFIRDYEALMAEIAAKLTPANHAVAVALASIPEDIRGYGHIKDEHVARAKKHEAELLKAFTAPAPVTMAAE
ncbi:MAG: indolepyruvate ferredoxin oxidoreductase family protein, partial [Alphaproteobacteria bacterium]